MNSNTPRPAAAPKNYLVQTRWIVADQTGRWHADTYFATIDEARAFAAYRANERGAGYEVRVLNRATKEIIGGEPAPAPEPGQSCICKVGEIDANACDAAHAARVAAKAALEAEQKAARLVEMREERAAEEAANGERNRAAAGPLPLPGVDLEAARAEELAALDFLNHRHASYLEACEGARLDGTPRPAVRPHVVVVGTNDRGQAVFAVEGKDGELLETGNPELTPGGEAELARVRDEYRRAKAAGTAGPAVRS